MYINHSFLCINHILKLIVHVVFRVPTGKCFYYRFFKINCLQFFTFLITYTYVCSIYKWHWRMQALHYEMSHCERRLSFVFLMTILSMIGSLRNLVPVPMYLRNLNY